MIKHQPKNKTNVKIEGKVYECNRLTGIVELPGYYELFNPIEAKPKKKTKKEEA
jgi:hypothetical protein